jgi:choline-sulfatase
MSEPQKPRNVLLIVSDQLAWRALPAYGNTTVRTPHIDRIVKSGVRFENCYCTIPLCQPSRASFWTGRFSHQTGVLSNGKFFPDPPIPENMATLGQLFSKAGYKTIHFGKTHAAGALEGFEVEPVKELPVPEEPAWPLNYDTRQDRYTTTRAVQFLAGDHPKPFLCVVDLNNPHNICDWIGANRGPHEDMPVATQLPELPANFRINDITSRPRPIQYLCCSHNRLAQTEGWTEENYRHYLAAYDHYVSRLDTEIGLVLDALAVSGEAENTLIVFTADHGDGITSHGMVTKQVCFYEEVMKVPLVFSGPGVSGKDTLIRKPLTSLLDLVPTLCDYARVEAPDDLWGRSLMPWIRGEKHESESPHDYVVGEWHTEWGDTIEPGRMIRTERYKYTRYLEGDGEELFDLSNDPGETKTLAHDPEHDAILRQHRKLLESHLKRTGDPFFSLTWKADPQWRSHPPGREHHKGPSAPMIRQKAEAAARKSVKAPVG